MIKQGNRNPRKSQVDTTSCRTDSDKSKAKLQLTPRDTPREIAKRFERERRVVVRHQESQLDQGLRDFRVGSVPYLNAVPLTRGLEDHLCFATPAKLAEMLLRDELDAALVSVVEVLQRDRYDILDGIAVASLGEVKSVYLAHRHPLDEMREVHCDPASLTSIFLLRVLLADRGLNPEIKRLASYAPETIPDFALLIGNPAIEFLHSSPDHTIWDLGAAWYESTRLPFVFAVWAMRRGIENEWLRDRLREARAFGLETLDSIIRERPEFDMDFRRDYLGWHIHYHLGEDEKRGLVLFMEKLKQAGIGPVYEPRFLA